MRILIIFIFLISNSVANEITNIKNLVINKELKKYEDLTFFNSKKEQINLNDFKGKLILLNFWATWCAPCRKEMPSLSELQKQLGDDTFTVVTIATMRNSPKSIQEFFDKIDVENLSQYNDPKGALSRSMGVLGLPTTLIVSKSGHEIGRLLGDADWASPEAIELMSAIKAADKRD